GVSRRRHDLIDVPVDCVRGCVYEDGPALDAGEDLLLRGVHGGTGEDVDRGRLGVMASEDLDAVIVAGRDIRAPQHRGTHALDSLAQATRIVGPRNRRRDRCEQRTERLAREWLRPYGEAPGRGAMSGQEQGVRNRSVDLGRLV